MKTLFKMFLTVACMFALISVQAQAVSLCDQHFSSKTPQNWSIQPLSSATVPTWSPDTSVAVSTPYSMHGHVPFKSGDTVEIITPYFDCSNYKYVMVQFSHICKVLPSDICQVMYQEQGLGTYYQWQPLPNDAYQGKANNYNRTLMFSHDSYNEWKSNDTLATPTNTWWKEESFDISNYASYTKVRFRFIIKTGSYAGSYIASGWYIDDFKVLASNTPIKKPVAEFLSIFNDTVYSTGPFTIKAKIASRSNTPIRTPELRYTTFFQGKYTNKNKAVKMKAVEGDSIWTATIPQQNYGTDVSYSIDAVDSVNNTAHIADGFTLKRRPGIKMTGYAYYHGGDTANPVYTYANNIYPTISTNPSYARSLYLANEIGSTSKNFSIATMAWYNTENATSASRNIKVWLLSTTATTTSGAMDPASNNATLVYNGMTNCQSGWNEVEFDAPFVLPAGKNLMVFIEGSNGTSDVQTAWLSYYSANRNVYNTNTASNTYTNGYYLPIMRFGLGYALNYDSNSVALTSIDQPGNGATSGSQTVKVTLQNKGLRNLTSAQLNWTVNGVLQTPKTWTGNLACDFYANITLGTYTQRSATRDTIVVWVSKPNGVADNILVDDTLTVTPYGCDKSMSGNYTVGNIKGADFKSLDDALFMLSLCGASSDVTIEIANGIYSTNLDLSNIMNNNYTLTITSLSKNADSVILSYVGNVVELNNSKNIVFDRLTLTSDLYNGSHAVRFKGNCSDIAFNHCKLNGPVSGNYDDRNYATVFSDKATLYNIRFIGNEITGGTFAFHIATGSSKKIVIDSNDIHGFVSGSTFSGIQDLEFSYNNVHGSCISVGKNPYWRNIFSNSSEVVINANRFYSDINPNSNSIDALYGVYVDYSDSIHVTNNEVVFPFGSSTRSLGIYSYYNTRVYIVNNSVLIGGGEKSDRSCCFGDENSTNGHMLNNIAISTAKSVYPLYLNVATATYTIDYNCWSSSDVVAYVFANNQWVSVGDLATLNLNIPSSIHDVLNTPAYKNDTDLHLNHFNGLSCTKFSSLNYDKDGLLRSAITTRGCYGTNPPQKDASLIAILNWPGTSYVGDTMRPSVVLQNSGLDTLTKASISFRLNDETVQNIQWTGNHATAAMDTIPLNAMILKSGYNTLTAYLISANGTKDSVTNNDTINVSTYTCANMFAGNYNVGDTCEFQDLNSAINAILRCGMNGPVTLRMLPGTYSTKLVLSDISGISDTNTLTVTSFTGKNDVILKRASESSENDAPIIIDGGKNIILDHLTFDATCAVEPSSYAYAHGIIVRGNSNSIEISNCSVVMPQPEGMAYSTTAEHSAIQLLDRTIHNIYVHDNTINGGGCGVYVYNNNSSARMRNVRVMNNTISNVDNSGIYVAYADSVVVKGNRISQRTGEFIAPGMLGIYAYYTHANILNNRVSCANVNRGISVEMFGDNTTGFSDIINNEITGKITVNNGCGLYIGNSTNGHIYHNSIYVSSNQRVASGVWMSANTGSITIDFHNNIVYMNGKSYNNYPLYRANSLNSDLNIGYNAFYNAYPGTPIMAYLDAPLVSWSEYKTAMPQDTTSRFTSVEFMNPNSSLRISDTLGISCPVIPSANFDINDSVRSGSKTTMGAYNYYRFNLDLAVTAIVNPGEKASTTNAEPLKVIIANKGVSTITSAKLSYRLQGVASTKTFNWTGKLATSASDTVTIDNIHITDGANLLEVYICEVNGKKDELQENDTTSQYVYGCNGPLKGTFTIGKKNANFASIAEAMNTIDICGLGGNVRFELANGTYAAATFEGITYTAGDKVITFASQAKDRDSVIFNGTNGLALKNVNYMHFENLTFNGTKIGVNMENAITSVSIHNCNINVPTDVTTTEYRGISYDNTYNSGFSMFDVSIVGNNISGGYYNIYLYYGTYSGKYTRTVRTSVTDNTMTGAYRYGLYSYESNDFHNINGNKISNGSNAKDFTGIYTDTWTNCDSMIGNTVHINVPGKAYGILSTTYQNNFSDMGGTRRVSNNEIIVKSQNEAYGISYTSPSGYANFIHNSIYVEGLSTSYGLYLSASSQMLKAYNNILVGGNTNSIPMYCSNTNNTQYSHDYNNYTAVGGGNLAYIGGMQATLAAIKAISPSMDQNSISIPVVWKDTDNLRMSNSWSFMCPVYDDLTMDILGMPRTYTTAMGCYDLEADTADAGLVQFVGADLITSSTKFPLSVIVKNNGMQPISSATITLSINGTSQTPITYNPSTPLTLRCLDTVLLGSFNFPSGQNHLVAYITLKGDKNTINDTIKFDKNVCPGMVGGTYVIGNSANADYTFANWTDLKDLIDSCGINADVTLAFESGVYPMSADINMSTDFMQGYHLTWTSLVHDRDSVKFTSSLGASSTAGMFILGNANNITFSDITCESTNHTVFQVNGPNKNVEILRCNLLNGPTATTGATMTITNGDNPKAYYKQQNWRVIGNRFEGGCRSFKFRGSKTEPMINWTIDSNEFFYGYDRIIQLEYVDTLYFRHNITHSRTSTTGNHFHLYLCAINHADISGNFFDDAQGSTSKSGSTVTIYGINEDCKEIATFANNVIISNNKSGKVINAHGKLDMLHNSIYMMGTANTACGIWLYTTYNISKVVGNVIYGEGTQVALGMNSDAINCPYTLDYNNYYCANGTICSWNGSSHTNGTKLTTIQTMQLTTLQDTHSVSSALKFVDPTKDLLLMDYKPVSMPNLKLVADDIDGNLRSNPTAMGAYEPSAHMLDAALVDFATTSFSGAVSTPVYVTLINLGLDTLKSAELNWVVNGVTQTKVKWTGSLPIANDTVILLGNYTPVAASTTNITAWVSNPNGTKDSKASNDTIRMSQYVCKGTYAGTYTIGGSNPDFTSLNEAASSMVTCGISAPVILKLRSGTYAASTVEGSIKGSSATNTITVMPDSGATVVIDGGSAGASLTVKNIAHWVFRNLTIGNTTNGLVGVSCQEDLEDVTFRNCDILANVSATSSTSYAVGYPNTSNSTHFPTDLRFIHNNIRGGYYNFYLYYTAGTAGSMSVASVHIDSNTLSDAYYASIYNYYFGVIKSLCYNTITNRSSSSTFYGVYSMYYAYWDKIEGNRMNLDATGTVYGFYLYYYNQYYSYTGSKKAYLVNNELYISSASGNKYGIHLYYPYGFWEVHHNSLYLRSAGTKYGMYLYNTSTAYQINATRNLVVCDSVGSTTGTNYPLYLTSATYAASTYGVREYNCFYSPTNVAYAGSALTSIAALQTASKQDSFSINVAPTYAHLGQNLSLTDYTAYNCLKHSDVPYDILGSIRGNATSMGCYGAKIFENLNLSVAEFVSPKNVNDILCYTDYTPVSVAIRNSGIRDACYDSSALKISLDVTGAVSYHFDTTLTTGVLKSSWTDTISLGLIPTMASGIYTIKVTLTDTADSRADDDTMTIVYNASRVELPYDVNFSTQPAEFVNIIESGKTGWQVVQGSGSNPSIAPVYGSGRLEFAGNGDPGANAMAVFNAVNINGCINPKLSFWYAQSTSAQQYDQLSVKITTDAGATFTELGRILAADTMNGWKRYDFDLSKYTNSQCASIVFEAYTSGKFNQNIDRILITAETDVALEMLPIDISGLVACEHTPMDVKAVLTNKASMNLDFVNDTITLNVTGAKTMSASYIYNGHIAGYTSDTITVAQLDFSANGNYYLELFMQSQDDNTANDTVRDSSIVIRQDIAVSSIQGVDAQTAKMAGDTIYVSSVIVNKGNIPVTRTLVHVGINGNVILTDTVLQVIKAGDSILHAMSAPFIVPATSKDQPYYVFELTASIDCDADENDNSMEIIAPVDIPDTMDIRVLDITANTPVLGKTKQAPTVRVSNVGNTTVYSLNVYVSVLDSTGTAVDNISGIISEIQPGDSTDYLFTMNYKVPNYNGNYTLKAFVEKQQIDNNQGNDTLSKVFGCILDDTRISESETLNWSMGQNVPNPASNITRIPFNLPNSGNVTFSVMAANGQLIYREEISAESGNNSVSFDASNIAGGIYYYSMEYNGQRIVRKMNVTR